MVLYVTVGVSTAVARVAAQPVYTRLVVGTVVVRNAARRYGDYNRVTFSVFVGNPAFRTGARHCSYWDGVQDGTVGSRMTRRNSIAWIYATVFDTSQFAGTVDV